MENPLTGDDIKNWLDAEVRKARIAKAKKYVIDTSIGRNYLRHLDDDDYLLLADKLENPTVFWASIRFWHNCGKLPVNLKKYKRRQM